MNKKFSGSHKHLTLSNRIFIEKSLNEHKRFKKIALILGKDPYASNPKGRLEKNHEFIRHVIPKGRSMNITLKRIDFASKTYKLYCSRQFEW